MIDTFADLRQWFRERLDKVLARTRIEAALETRAYLVELLGSMGAGARAVLAGEPLVIQLARAQATEPGVQKLRQYRELADEALCLSGFFAEHLERRGLSPGYVHTVGAQGYESAGVLSRLSHAESGRTLVYHELGTRFSDFALVLEEVRETTALRTPQDIVKLYDTWQRTRSDTIAQRLVEEGVFPVASGEKIIH